MLVHARFAVAWPQLVVTVVLAVLALEEAGRDPWRMWPLEGIAVALLVAAVAWCLEDPVPEVARATPRQPRWGLAPRALGLGPAVVVWVAAVLLVGGTAFGQRPTVLVQGLAAVVAGVGGILAGGSLGAHRPARWCAGVVVPLVVALALVNPLPELLPLFPYGPTGPWRESAALWVGVATAGLGALVLALAEATWWRARDGALRRRPSGARR